MTYTIVTLTIDSGWHETYMQRLAKGNSIESIIEQVDKAAAQWWRNPDEFTPTITAGTPREISQAEYEILKKYINEIK